DNLANGSAVSCAGRAVGIGSITTLGATTASICGGDPVCIAAGTAIRNENVIDERCFTSGGLPCIQSGGGFVPKRGAPGFGPGPVGAFGGSGGTGFNAATTSNQASNVIVGGAFPSFVAASGVVGASVESSAKNTVSGTAQAGAGVESSAKNTVSGTAQAGAGVESSAKNTVNGTAQAGAGVESSAKNTVSGTAQAGAGVESSAKNTVSGTAGGNAGATFDAAKDSVDKNQPFDSGPNSTVAQREGKDAM